MRIHDQALIKLNLNMPSLAGQLLATEFGQNSNLTEAFAAIRKNTDTSIISSKSYKTSKNNVEKLAILSISTTQIEIDNILGTTNRIVFTLPSLTLTQHSSNTLETNQLLTNSLIAELQYNHVCYELVPQDQLAEKYRAQVISDVVKDPKLPSLLKGWGIDVLLLHSESIPEAASILDSGLTIGSIVPCQNQKEFIDRISGVALNVSNEKAITLEAIGCTSPTKSTSNIVITNGSAERVALLGERSEPMLIQPYFVDISFPDLNKSNWFNQFISSHFQSTVRCNELDKQLPLPKASVESRLCEIQNEITTGWMNGFD